MLVRIRKQLRRLVGQRRALAAIRTREADFGDIEAACRAFAAPLAQPFKSLDLGCGGRPRNPFGAAEVCGIDIRADEVRGIRYADLCIESIPFPDASFDFVTAFDFLEHVPRVLYAPARRFAFVELMNEIHRVLRPGGALLSHTPAFPHAAALRDPTHVNIITEETFPLYFDDHHRWAAAYGFRGTFRVVRQGWSGAHLVSLLAHSAGIGSASADGP